MISARRCSKSASFTPGIYYQKKKKKKGRFC